MERNTVEETPSEVGFSLLTKFRLFLARNTLMDGDAIVKLPLKQLFKQLELRINLEAIQKEIDASNAPVEPRGAAAFLTHMP